MERKPEDITADNYTEEDLGAVLEDHADDAVPYCDPNAEERTALERLYYLAIQSRDWARAFDLAAQIESLSPSVY
jgi:hypothetical protein